jgi:hypothetical protein
MRTRVLINMWGFIALATFCKETDKASWVFWVCAGLAFVSYMCYTFTEDAKENWR